MRCAIKILDVDPDGEEDGASQDLDSQRKGKCAVIKTSTRQVSPLQLLYFLTQRFIHGATLLFKQDNIPTLDRTCSL